MLIEDDGINYPLIILLFFIIIQKSIPERMTMIFFGSVPGKYTDWNRAWIEDLRCTSSITKYLLFFIIKLN
jgi:hypothetical protein